MHRRVDGATILQPLSEEEKLPSVELIDAC
jgi:hypothetical protein